MEDPSPAFSPPDPQALEADPRRQQLVDEVQKILDAGHLRPAYGMVGIWEAKGIHRFGDDLVDYWHNPSETVLTLLNALPLLPEKQQAEVRAYLQDEVAAYPLHSTAHVGWRDGASRNAFDLPPEVEQAAQSFGPKDSVDFNDWGLPPINLYAMWRYAQEFGDAQALFEQAKEKVDFTPEFQASIPYVVNSYLAGYSGFLRLAALAGAGPQPQAERALIDMLLTRAALAKFPTALQETGFEYGGYEWTVRHFTPTSPDTLFDVTATGNLWNQLALYGFPVDWQTGLTGPSLGGGYAFAIDFVNLTPETAAFLRQYVPAEAQAIWQSYTRRAPYWFVAEAEETGGESVYQPLFNRWAFFQAKALVMGASRAELEPYLDVPAVPVGDLYFIQNLVTTLQAE